MIIIIMKNTQREADIWALIHLYEGLLEQLGERCAPETVGHVDVLRERIRGWYAPGEEPIGARNPLRP